jgi:hypothetical protein
MQSKNQPLHPLTSVFMIILETNEIFSAQQQLFDKHTRIIGSEGKINQTCEKKDYERDMRMTS